MNKKRKKGLSVRIIGSGLVGTAVGKGSLARGISVSFVDIDQDKVLALKKEGLRSYTSEELRSGKVEGNYSFITVPTPNTK